MEVFRKSLCAVDEHNEIVTHSHRKYFKLDESHLSEFDNQRCEFKLRLSRKI
jgi:hypothetical protein